MSVARAWITRHWEKPQKTKKSEASRLVAEGVGSVSSLGPSGGLQGAFEGLVGASSGPSALSRLLGIGSVESDVTVLDQLDQLATLREPPRAKTRLITTRIRSVDTAINSCWQSPVHTSRGMGPSPFIFAS